MNVPAKITSAAQALAVLEEVKLALSVCVSIDQVKDIRDRAEAIRCYHKQAKDSHEAQNYAAEIKIRAERRGGELLKEMEKAKGGQPYQSHNATSKQEPTLADLGINKTQSSRWQAIASLPEEKFEEFVGKSQSGEGELTTASALKLAKKLKVKEIEIQPKSKRGNRVQELEATDLKFKCVYADPPWQYGNQATRASTDNHYVTMTVEQIAALPVERIVEDQAVLFLWTTNGFLFECREVIEAWGFEFKSSMVWVKPQMGIGNYVRNAHEFLLICSRGGMRTDGKSQISWLESRRGKHSKKPQVFRQVIEKICPGPRLEMFARQTAPGWHVWGNEVESTLFGG